MSCTVSSEASLVDSFLDAFKPSGCGSAVLREFETLAGIPDVVFVEAAKAESDLRIELEASRTLTNGHANVITCLNRSCPHHIQYIAARTGLGTAYVQRIVSDLRQLGVVELTNRGSVLLTRDYALPRLRFVAIEFKLSDWRRAMSQAIRHQSFADKTLVVMPANRARSLREAASAFRAYGVGSAVFDPGSCRLTYVVRPRSRRHTSDRIFLDAAGRAGALLIRR